MDKLQTGGRNFPMRLVVKHGPRGAARIKRLFRTPHARIENFIAVVRAVIHQENSNRRTCRSQGDHRSYGRAQQIFASLRTAQARRMDQLQRAAQDFLIRLTRLPAARRAAPQQQQTN
jgi:hypothetical protein